MDSAASHQTGVCCDDVEAPLLANELLITEGGMKVFFDVDGVLIDGWHADVTRRKPWDATIEADLGVDREAFKILFSALQAVGLPHTWRNV